MRALIVGNPEACLIAVAALTFLTIVANRARPRNSLPLVVHNCLWALTFLAIGTDLARYSTISTKAWAVLAIGILAFNVGYLVPRRKTEAYEPPAEHGSSMVSGLTISRRTFVALSLAYAIGVSIYLLRIHTRYGIATLLTNPTLIRGDKEQPYMASIPFWARLLLFIGPFLFVAILNRRSLQFHIPRLPQIFALIAIAISMLLLIQRTNLFMAVLWAGAFYLFTFGTNPARAARAKVGKTIATVVLASCLALGSFQLVASALGKTGGQAVSSGAISDTLERTGLTSPFMYGTSGVIAFSALVDSTNKSWPDTSNPRIAPQGNFNPQTWGAATFAPLLKVVPAMEPWPAISPFIEIPFLTNVYTWFEGLYRDFRAPGVALGMLAQGAALSLLYQNRIRSSSAFWIGSLLLSTVFLSTFAMRFNTTIYVFNGLLAYVFTRSPRRRVS